MTSGDIHAGTSTPLQNLRSQLGARATQCAIGLGVISILFGAADLLWLDVGTNGAEFTWPPMIVIAVCSVSLMVYRHIGIWVVAACGLGRILVAVAAATETPMSLGSSIAIYLYARHASRRKAILGAVFSAVTSVASVVITDPTSVVSESILEVTQSAVIAGIGMTVRVNAVRNERLIEAEATKRAQADRLHLARDLHDVIAHSLSSIAVMSGVAGQLIDRDPAHAKEALADINEAGRSSLDELRAFLGLLRSEDYLLERTVKPIQPDDFGILINGMAMAGLPVDLRTEGEFPKGVDQSVLSAAHDIVHEALINVARHAGPVQTSVELLHHDDALDLRIRNAPAPSQRGPVPSTGMGIVGMSERADAVGGSLTTSSPALGGFEVAASLPYRSRGEA